MRIALFSDVHGNLPALAAVLEALGRHGALDALVCAGDQVYLGPHPSEVLDRLQAAGVRTVRGNADDLVSGLLPIESEAPPTPEIAARHAAHVAWNRARLQPAQLADLAALPLSLRFSPAPGQDLLICHADPASNASDSPRLGALDTDGLRRVYGAAQARVVAFGHWHQPYVVPLDNLTLLNIACVSIPMDGQALANYTIAEWDGCWRFQQHRMAYPLEPLRHAIEERAMPRPPWPRG